MPSASAMKMLSSSRPPSAPAASRRRSGKVARICSSVCPARRSFRIRATSCAVAADTRPGTSTKMRAHHPAPEVEDQQQPLGADRYDFEPLEHHLVERRRHRDAQLLRQDAEHLGGSPEDLLHRVA